MTRLRGLVALIALLTMVVGIPWALVAYGNWPITGVPSGEQLRDMGGTVVSDTTVFAVLTVAAWVVWAVFIASVLVEAVAAVRGVQAPRLALAGPLQRSARGLVAALVVAVTIHHSSPSTDAGAASAALFVQRTAVVLDIASPTVMPAVPVASAPAATAATATAVLEPSGVVVTVQPGDSAWSIADAHLGDGMRWRDLWEANRSVLQPDGRSWTDPQIIRVGWQLRLPTTIRSDPAAPSATSAAPAAAVQTVVRGDTLSGIADAHLGDPARYTEIFELNRDVEQPDGRRLTDPNLILPGWILRLPDVTTQTSAVPSPPPAAPDIAGDDPLATTETPPPDTTPTTTTIPTTSAPRPTTVPTSTPTATAPRSDPRDVGGGSESSESGWTTNAPSLAGIAGAVVLATGLAIRIRFLRRRQATRGCRADHPLTGESRQIVDAVTAAADVALVRWAGQRLAQLVLRLDRNTVTGAPVAVELSETAGIELLWDSPQPDAPDPWTAADGGWAWRLAYDADAAVPADELPAAIPALVTIGHRDGRQLMIDLEAYGAITVAGDDDRVDALLRSITIELATNQDLADAYVHVVGIDAGISYLDRLHTTSIDNALHLLNNACRAVTDALTAAQLDGTFIARIGSPTPIETTIVIARAGTPDATAAFIQAAPPRRGVAVITGTDATDTSAPGRIVLLTDGTARLEPLGIVFSPVALPSETATKLDELLEGLEHTTVIETGHQQDDPEWQATDATLGKPSTNGHHAPTSNTDDAATHLNGRRPGASTDAAGERLGAEIAADGTDSKPAMLVRVLGTPTVSDRPDLSRRELILTVLLACRRGPVAASTAQDALWGGKAVEAKTVWNVIGATRQALGDLPDGTPVMPSADRSRSTLCVAAGVITDVIVLRSLVERAHQAPSSEAIELLREGLALVDGQPFDAAGYDWAHRDQDVAEASALIEHAAVQLVDLALDSDLVDVARDAIVRGLRGLPGNEELYRCRMRVEYHSANLAGVSAAYEELVTYLADLETEPSPSTTALYRELVRPLRR